MAITGQDIDVYQGSQTDFTILLELDDGTALTADPTAARWGLFAKPAGSAGPAGAPILAYDLESAEMNLGGSGANQRFITIELPIAATANLAPNTYWHQLIAAYDGEDKPRMIGTFHLLSSGFREGSGT